MGGDGGLSGGVSVHRSGSKDPHRRQWKFSTIDFTLKSMPTHIVDSYLGLNAIECQANLVHINSIEGTDSPCGHIGLVCSKNIFCKKVLFWYKIF